MKMLGITVLLVGGLCAILWLGGNLSVTSLAVTVGLLSGIAVSIPIGALLLFFVSNSSRSKTGHTPRTSEPSRSAQKQSGSGKKRTAASGSALHCRHDASYSTSASLGATPPFSRFESVDASEDLGEFTPVSSAGQFDPPVSDSVVLSESLPYIPAARVLAKRPGKQIPSTSTSPGATMRSAARYVSASKAPGKRAFTEEPTHTWDESWPTEVPYQPELRRAAPVRPATSPSRSTPSQPKSRQFRILGQDNMPLSSADDIEEVEEKEHF